MTRSVSCSRRWGNDSHGVKVIDQKSQCESCIRRWGMIATDSDRPVDCYIVDKSIVELEKKCIIKRKQIDS